MEKWGKMGSDRVTARDYGSSIPRHYAGIRLPSPFDGHHSRGRLGGFLMAHEPDGGRRPQARADV